MKNNKKLLFLFVFLFVLMAGGMAVANTPDISLPDLTAEKKGALEHDMTAGVYSQILGPAWAAVWGDNAILGGLGQYSGLFLKICQALNIAAMGAVVAICAFTGVSYAIQKAHYGKTNGKLGPMGVIRLGTTSALTAPVFYGLSVMQYFLIVCIGWSLVFAGNIWQAGAEYIVENIESPVLDSAPPLVDGEAMNAPVPLFYAVLTQEYLKEYHKGSKGDMADYRNPNIRAGKMGLDYSEYAGDSWGYSVQDDFELSVQGDYVIEHRPKEGVMILYPMPGHGMTLGDLGSIHIPSPTEPKEDATKDEKTLYSARLKIAQERIRAFVDLADNLRPYAINYMAMYAHKEEGKAYGDNKEDALHLINAYRKQVTDAAIPLIKSLEKSNSSISERLRLAFGIEKGKSPSGGWIMSGIAPALTAIVSNQAEILHYGGGVKFTPPRRVVADRNYTDITTYYGEFTLPHLNNIDKAMFQNALSYASQVLMRGRAWSGLDVNGEPAGNFNKIITKAFYGGEWSNLGIWDATVKTLSEKNPFAAVMDFGKRLLSIFAYMLVPSAAAGIAGSFPGLGAINDLVNNPVFTAILLATVVSGIVFSVVTILFIKDILIKALGAYFIAVSGTFLGSSLWLVAHAFPEGEGFVGQHARKGYVMVLEVLMRPALIVTGVFLTIILTSAISKVLLQLFVSWTTAYSSFETFGAGEQLLWSIALVAIVWSLLMFIARKLIIELPDKVIAFVGGVGTMSGVEQSNVSTVGAINGMIGKIGAGFAGIGAGLAIGAKGSSLGKKPKKDDAPAPTNGDAPGQMAPKTE